MEGRVDGKAIIVTEHVNRLRDEAAPDWPQPPEGRSGVHRCVGDRLAELQIKILWEEFLRKGYQINHVGAEARVYSNKIRGIASLPVVLSL